MTRKDGSKKSNRGTILKMAGITIAGIFVGMIALYEMQPDPIDTVIIETNDSTTTMWKEVNLKTGHTDWFFHKIERAGASDRVGNP